MQKNTKKILYFIQIPPPIHGVSTMNKIVYESNKINFELNKDLLPIKFSNTIISLQKLSASKIIVAIVLLLKLFVKLLSFKPDIVYFSITPTGFGFVRDTLYVSLLKLFRKKIIFHIHNKGIEDKQKNPIYKFLYTYSFSNNYIIQLSSGILKKETQKLPLKNSKQFIVENGIKLFTSKINKKENHKITLLFLSNLIPGKGIFTLLKAFNQLSKEYHKLHLSIIGEKWNNKTTKKIQLFITKNRLNTKIDFKGPVIEKNKYKEMQHADIFVFPTYYDSFPLVILEAMQAKLPIISTYEGAIPEIIENNKTGILIEQKNVPELIKKIKLLIENKELRTKLGENAYVKFKKNYTHEIFEKKMRNVFENILSHLK